MSNCSKYKYLGGSVGRLFAVSGTEHLKTAFYGFLWISWRDI